MGQGYRALWLERDRNLEHPLDPGSSHRLDGHGC